VDVQTITYVSTEQNPLTKQQITSKLKIPKGHADRLELYNAAAMQNK